MRDPVRDLLERFASGEPLLEETRGRTLLRVGLAVVFVWFGVDKFLRPGYWPMWVPDALPWLASVPALHAVGVSEVALGLGLASGRRTRALSLATAGYLTLIVASQGVGPVVRDVGLLGAALYLGLTTPGPTDDETLLPGSVPSPGPASSIHGKVLLAGLLVVGLVGGTVAFVGMPGPKGSSGPLLAFEEPADGATVGTRDVPVRISLRDRVHELGLDHLHVKVDGAVVDALYFADDEEVTTTLNLDAGERRVGAYLAYVDHVEYEDSWTQIRVTAGR